MTTTDDTHESTLIFENHERAYPPSWVDRFTEWVAQLKLPGLIFYINLWLILLIIETLIQGNNESYPIGTPNTFHLFHKALGPIVLAMIHYLDKAAGEALGRFRAALDVSERKYAELHYRLTTLPQRPAIFASLAGLLFGAANLVLVSLQPELRVFVFGDTLISLGFNGVLSLIIFSLGALLFYHTLHQLGMVNHIYKKYARINLYNLYPLFSLSGISGRTAIGIVFLAYSWFATTPVLINQTVPTALSAIGIATAIFAFIWPLLGIHNLLLAEKERMLVECNQRFEHVSAMLHQQIDGENLAQMDELHKTLEALEIEHKALYRIPTWPWQPETIRGVVAALFFPVVLWMVQWVLGRVLGA